MNGQTIAINNVFSEVLILEKAISELKAKLLQIIPSPYGSDLWWEKSDTKAIDDIKNGKGKKFKNYEESVKYLTA